MTSLELAAMATLLRSPEGIHYTRIPFPTSVLFALEESGLVAIDKDMVVRANTPTLSTLHEKEERR